MVTKAVLVSAGHLLLLCIQVPALVKSKRWRDLAAYVLLLLVSWGIALVMVLKLPVPTPTDLITRVLGDYAAKLMDSP